MNEGYEGQPQKNFEGRFWVVENIKQKCMALTQNENEVERRT
jgi:hypothetical protein